MTQIFTDTRLSVSIRAIPGNKQDKIQRPDFFVKTLATDYTDFHRCNILCVDPCNPWQVDTIEIYYSLGKKEDRNPLPLFAMTEEHITLPPDKKIYFASDFHLGVPTPEASLEREKKIVSWLESIRHDAHSIYLLGDIFDFWFEYRHSIPKGFIRLQGKLAALRDAGIPIYFFTGNHDMWMFDYFPGELGIVIYREPIVLNTGQQRLLIGHGDGLGPGDFSYKILKTFFNSSICKWLFAWIHPNLGMSIAHYWSKQSRITNMKTEEKFAGPEKEFLFVWCSEQEQKEHHDFYVFGHRHLPLDLAVGDSSRYINIGEWVHYTSYGVYDGSKVELKRYST